MLYNPAFAVGQLEVVARLTCFSRVYAATADH